MKRKKNKKCISVVACILSLLMAIELAAPYLASESDNVIYIRTAQELLELSENCGYDQWSRDKKIVLCNDISLKGIDFEPIPYFAGTFDGYGHTISDFELDGNYQPAGIFGVVKAGALIKNLNVTGSVMPSGDRSSVGSIVGVNSGIIENCQFSGVVSGKVSVGGIVGINTATGQIINCYAKGHMFGEHFTGGIVGRNLGTITGSSSDAYVNNTSGDSSISLDDLGTNLLLDLYAINSSDITNSATDSGGIAGCSSGTIRECINNGVVGYPHVGYNAGGIVGRNSGYIEKCTNNGDIYGRKDIGGIVGQVEPFIDMEVSVTDLSVLEVQLEALKQQIDTTADNALNTSEELNKSLDIITVNLEKITAAIDKIEQIEISENEDNSTETTASLEDMEGAQEDLENVQEDIENLEESMEEVKEAATTVQEALSEITDAMNEITAELRVINDITGTASDQANTDIKKINELVDNVCDTIVKIVDESKRFSAEDLIEDTSTENIADVTFGKIGICVNHGTIYGDLNVGGIAGIMSIESELDPEDDMTTEISWEERTKYKVKAILYGCVNHGNVTAKKDTVGAICGQMDIGTINSCSGYGSAGSESGDYVGGIAGIARTTISDCIVNCELFGNNYIGGIIGSGYEIEDSGSVVKNCYSMVKITEGNQFVGAIAGYDSGTFENNYFVSNELEGIDRISYKGMAQPMSYDELLQIEGLPKELKSFTLSFVADDKEIKTLEFNYGDSFGEDVFPELPKKDGFDGAWDIIDLSNLCFDTVVTAVYTPYVTVIESEEVRKNDRPVLLIEGDFSTEDVLSITEMVLTEALDERFKMSGELVERWNIQFSDDGQKRHTIRFLPEKGMENSKLYVRVNNSWEQVDITEIGSYMAFDVTGNAFELAVVSRSTELVIVVSIIAGFLLLVLLCIFLQKKFRVFSKIKELALKKLVIVVVIVVILGAIAGGTVIMIPKVQTGMEIATIIQEALEIENHSMKMNLNVKIGEKEIELHPDLYTVKVNDNRFLVMKENDIPVYISKNAIFFENGKGFQIGVDLEGDNSILQQVQDLYDSASITRSEMDGNVIYSVTAQDTQAKKLLTALVPAIENYLSSTELVELHVTTYENKIEQVSIVGSASIKDSMDTSIKVEATLSDYAELGEGADIIPKEILEAIENTEASSLPDFSEDLYRLFVAWMEFNGREDKSGTVSLEASCALINFKYELPWNSEEIETDQISNPEEIAQMPKLIYTICLEGEFSCEEKANSYVYTLTLDEAAKQKLAGMIAPEIVTQAVNLTNGTLYVTVEDEVVTSIEVDIEGTVTVLLVEVDASVKAIFEFE